MEVRLWGVRGSLPTPLTTEQFRGKVEQFIKLLSPGKSYDRDALLALFLKASPEYTGVLGGNTACIEIRADNKILILDMGSGLKNLGKSLMHERQPNAKLELHIFVSHTHWDHIMGFPFFAPAYSPHTTLNFYSCHPHLQERLAIQQDYRFFPVSFEQMPASKKFIQLEHNSTFQLGNISIRNTPLNHPGGSFGFRIECGGKVCVYATDSEFKTPHAASHQASLQLFSGADLLIFDAQYTFEEAIHKEDWGHSSALVAVELAVQAKVKNLLLFHHDPDRSDAEIYSMLERARDFLTLSYPEAEMQLDLAREGAEYIL